MFDLALEYIWKHTHCSAIRIHQYFIKETEGEAPIADKKFREFLKDRGFKWKNLTNEDNNVRYSVNEKVNTEYTNQMRKSRAHVFRKGMDKEDLLREPVSLYFATMAAYGHNKEPTHLNKMVPLKNQNEVQSIANVVQNLCLLNMKLNANGRAESEIENGSLPKLSEI